MLSRLLIACLLLLLTLPSLAASVQGLPLLQRYAPRDHHASAINVSVLAARGGEIYVGNARGVLRFDGGHWDLLELPGRTAARSLGVDPQGRVYVGGYDRFGRVDTDETGSMRFVDLTGELLATPDAPPLGQVWIVCSTASAMYVFTDSVLVRMSASEEPRHWPMDGAARAPFCTRDAVYARIKGKGFSRLADDGYQTIAGGEPFATSPLYEVFERDGGVVAVGDAGFYQVRDGQMRLMIDSDNQHFADYPPYSGVQLADGSLAFGTYAGELLHFSPELRLLSVQAVAASTIFELAADAEGGLWAATEGDLLRLRFPSPWSLFSAETGLIGQAYDSAWFADSLYVATSLGVFRADEDGGRMLLRHAVETVLEAAALAADPAGLLIGDRQGVLLLGSADGEATRLLQSDAPVVLLRSEKWPQRVYAPATGTLDLIALRDGRWKHIQSHPLGTLSLAGVEEDAEGALWLGDTRGGPLRLRFDAQGQLVDRRVFSSADGLQLDPEYGSYVLTVDEVVHVVSGRRVQRYADGSFETVDASPFNLFPEPFDLSIESTPVGDFAYDSSRLLLRRPGEQRWQPVLAGAALSGGYTGLHMDADGVVRLNSWDGLLQFDPATSEPDLPPLAVRMRSVTLRVGDGDDVRQPLISDADVPVFPAGALAQIDFGMPTSEPSPQFRLRIKGMFDDYSSWGPVVKPALNLRVPGPGDYQLEVEGRTPSGRVAEPLLYRFKVVPEWWQHKLAKAGALLLALAALLGLGMLGLRWRHRRLVEVNRALELRIAERTAELETANQKLAELATEDELTGMANRRALDQALAREWDRCRELQQSLAVVMLDVDHFKQYNDQHGHLQGDQHLVRVGEILQRHGRPVRELVARFGGEEFVLVLPGTDIQAACERAEAIRAEVERLLGGTTLSAGVAAAVPGEDGGGPNAILQRADMALYRAKSKGRNRVELDD